jgi:hypothetical protein
MVSSLAIPHSIKRSMRKLALPTSFPREQFLDQ